MSDERRSWKEAVLRDRRTRHPRVLAAMRADARQRVAVDRASIDSWSRGRAFIEVGRLIWDDDAYLALALYRIKARAQALGIPVVPRLAHRLAMALAQICIGDPVVLAPGVALVHGQVVLDGLVEVGRGTVIGPWVTIGLRAGDPRGPTIGAGVSIGPGAKVIGPVTVGDGATIGPNSVVVDDVAPGVVVAGIPARVLR